MPDRLVLDLPIVLDRDGKFDLHTIADTVGMWEYQKQEHQLLFSPHFLAPYIQGVEKERMLFSDVFDTDSRLHFQNFIKHISANSFATCVSHFKTLEGRQRVLFCSISQDRNRIRGLCLLIPDFMSVSKRDYSQTPESAKYATIGKMAGSIAHEINNPLSVIRMNAEILLASEALLSQPEKVREKCQKIISTTDRMASIVRALRSMSASTQKPQFSWVCFGDLIDDIIELSQPKLKQEGVTVRVNIMNVKHEKYFIDYAQITQALINLLNNSCDAVRCLPEKWIRIETDIRDEFLHILVIDSGTGVPNDIFKKITDELFSTKGAQGLGLGLNLVQAYVSSHGGHLGYNVHENHTCFYIALPLSIIKPEGNPLNKGV